MIKMLYVLTAMLNGETYVLDEGLTATDCMQALEKQAESYVLPVGDSEWISSDGAFYACETMIPARGTWSPKR